jgi:glutaminyl-peptide cyclotransferase
MVFAGVRTPLALIVAGAMSVFLTACSASTPAAAQQTLYDYEIVNTYPHDPEAFTQGLFFLDGALYESTGLKGRSSLRKVDLETGHVLQRYDLPPDIFGEGITNWKNRVVQITWRSQRGFVYDLASFEQKKTFTYPGEGWGIAQDGRRLIMSDGSADLRFLDPKSLRETGRVRITHRGKPVARLNELEYVDGAVFANIWQSDLIVQIDPESGVVSGVIDLRGLRGALGPDAHNADVLNGIAYDSKNGRLFVTGKLWPALFEIRLIESRPDGE